MRRRNAVISVENLEPRDVPAVDLLATSFAVAPVSGRVGDPVTVQFQITNAGSSNAPGFVVAIYASADATISTADDLVGSMWVQQGLLAGQATTLSGAGIVPSDAPPGNYTLGLFIDPENTIGDANPANNANQGTGIDQATFAVVATAPGDSQPAERVVGVSPGDGGGGSLVVVDPATGAVIQEITPFEPTFTGGIRTTTGDVDNNGSVDVIAVPGPGRPTDVRVFDVRTGATVRTADAVFGTFTGGMFAAAADFNADGFSDVVVTPDVGGGPRVIVMSGKDGSVMASFFGIDDPNFRGGARASVGDLNHDGTPDLIVSAGFGGGPRVAFFDGRTVGPGLTPQKLANDVFVFEDTLRNGVYVAAGDLNGDGFADPVFGAGPGGGPRVYAVSGQDLLASGTLTQLANFFGGDPANRTGIRVAVKDVDGDQHPDLVVGPGTGSTVTAYAGLNLPVSGDPTVLSTFDDLGGVAAGVFVG